MTRFCPRTAPLRRAGGLAAAALLLAAGPLTVAAAAPARAADPVYALGGPAETALHPYAEGGGEPKRSTAGITVTRAADEVYEGEFTVTFDLTGIAGVADAAFDARAGVECAPAGPRTTVCTGHGISPGPSTVTDLLLSAAAGSGQGASGTVRVTGEAGGAAFTPYTTKVTVGGPDLVMHKLPFDHEPTPGRKQQAPITFTNRGSRDADGVVLTLRYSRGLDIPQRYSNCAYTADATWTTARCSVPGVFEAGATYTLAAPLTLQATARAYRDIFVYGIHEAGTARRAAAAAAPTTERGPGAVLRAVPVKQRPSARSVDLEPGDNEQEADFRTANTADFIAYGDEASGPAGATVTARLGFRNDGPAWIGYLRSGETVAAVDFTVPQGATVTSAPKGCRGVTAEGAYREDRQAPAPRYVCPTPATVREGGGLDLSFGLRIDKVLSGAAGSVTVRGPGLRAPGLPFDPKPGNNTARVVLNGGSGSGLTPSPSPAPPTKGGPGAGAGTAPSATATPGAGGTGAPVTTGNDGGTLASTGASAVLTAAAMAVAALTAGLALFLAAGRRRS
ncbi:MULTISPECIES: peptidase [Streptomyces]|uniref:peptidase n=1 Tax=Streptomyces TaxID=1883 RepID=UPI000D510D4D|nr:MULTISPECIES: peptidase [Streptomyces]PVC72929.1 peptidase [Streptomyces sp. CS065A]